MKLYDCFLFYNEYDKDKKDDDKKNEKKDDNKNKKKNKKHDNDKDKDKVLSKYLDYKLDEFTLQGLITVGFIVVIKILFMFCML